MSILLIHQGDFYQNDQENKRNNLVPYLTRFEPLGEMVIFGTYLRAGRGSEPVWLRGPKTSPKKKKKKN